MKSISERKFITVANELIEKNTNWKQIKENKLASLMVCVQMKETFQLLGNTAKIVPHF